MTDGRNDTREPEVAGQPVGSWLSELGSAAPTPGGGGAAAMTAAVAAGLVEMVCNLTVGRPRYAEHSEHAAAVLERATALRGQALALVTEDATAFDALMATFKLPKSDEAERAARTAAVQRATEAAARVPLRIAALAAEVVQLAEQLPGRSNPNVLSDVGVAASTAAAALESAALNVEINLSGLTDQQARQRLTVDLATHTAAVDRGRKLFDQVRGEING